MDCAEVEARGVAEAYMLGSLNPDEQEAYERHYFECHRCYAELEALGTVRGALSSPARPVAVTARWMPLALAAALVAGIGGLLVWQYSAVEEREAVRPSAGISRTTTGQPSPAAGTKDLGRLARFEPPPYVPVRLRGGEERPAFTEGMRRYSAGDYAGAIPLLQKSDGEDARFYLGASCLLAGRPEDARAPLGALGRNARSPYAEEALFLLANAELKLGNGQAALTALDRTIALEGDRQRDARALRARITAVLSK